MGKATFEALTLEQLHTIVSHISDGVLIVSTQGTILFANAAAQHILYPQGHDPTGEPFELPSTERAEIALSAHGRAICLELHVSTIRWEQGEAFLVNLRDVTERKASEVALKDSEETYRLLFEHNPHPMWLYQPGSLRILAVNEAAVNRYGYSRKEFLQLTLHDLRPPEEVSRLLEHLKEQKAKGLSPPGRWVHRKKDGTLIHVEISAHDAPYQGERARLVLVHDVSKQVEAERQLRESEARLRSALEAADMVSWVWDIQSNQIYRHGRYPAMFGLAPEDIAPDYDQFARILHPEDLPRMERALQESIECGAPYRIELRIRHPDGSVRWGLDSGRVLYNEHGQAEQMAGVLIDISEQKRAEEALRESEQRYRLLAKNIPDSDLLLFDHDLRFTLAEGTEMRKNGQTPADFEGKTLHESLDEKLVARLEPAYRQALAGTPSRVELEYGANHYDIRTVPIRNDANEITGGLVVARNVTELKRTERDVRELNAQLRQVLSREKEAHAVAERQREQLQHIIDQAPALMCVLSGENYVYESINQAYANAFGEHIRNRPIFDVFPELLEQGVKEMFDQVRSSGKAVSETNLPYHFDIDQDGTPETYYFNHTIQPFYRDSGTVAGVLVHAIDVTESALAGKQLEQHALEIQRLNETLEARVQERTAQLRAINEELESFAYSVSHDLRTPLRGIDGFSRALLEDYQEVLDDTGKHYLQRVRNATQRMGELIDDLLALSRISRATLNKKSVDLSAIAQGIIEALRGSDPEREVTVEIAAELPAYGDPALLHTALSNLLDNAWKFTSKTAQPRIQVGCEMRDGQRVFFVRDNGAGFDERYKDKLFSAFQRLHSSSDFPGTGIGLATVRRVVHRHQGNIWAEGKVGQGATFSFTLASAKAHPHPLGATDDDDETGLHLAG